MKKILSCTLVLIMALALFAMQVSAATGTVVLSAAFDKAQYSAGESGTLNVTIDVDNATEYVAAADIYFVAKGFTAEAALSNLTQDGGDLVSGDIAVIDNENGNYQISFVASKNGALGKAVLSIPIQIAADATEVSATFAYDDSYVSDPDGEEDFTLDSSASTGAKATIASSKPSNVIEKTGSLADTGFINNLRVIDEKGTETKGFIGAAIGFKFVTPADITLDDNMIWALTTADGKAYSPKFNAGLSALGKNADVTVAATLTTGVDGVNTEITAVNGIFKDAASDTYYYTDATDAPTE